MELILKSNKEEMVPSLPIGKLNDLDKRLKHLEQTTVTSLTTLGSSGVATLINGVLNIPQYSGGGGGTPALPFTSVQFNDSGSFGGDAGFTYDKASGILGIEFIRGLNSGLTLQDASGNSLMDLGASNTGAVTFTGSSPYFQTVTSNLPAKINNAGQIDSGLIILGTETTGNYVSDIASGDSTITFNQPTGSVDAIVNQASPFTWTADHTFKNNINFFPSDSGVSSFNMLYGDTNGVSQLKFFDDSNKYVGFQSGIGNNSIIWTLPLKDANGFWYSDGLGNLSIQGISVDGVTITGNGTISNPLVAVGGGGSGLTVGTTTITSGTNTKVLFDNSGVLGEYTISGSGNVAMTTSPVFTTPNIGSATGSISGNAATATNVAVGGITGLGTGVATWLATPSSANLASAMTDETGSGALVFGTGPTITLASASTAVTQSANDNSTKIATTAYVDSALASFDNKPEVQYCSTSALPANTYSNGSSGVGATLTGSSNGPLIIDGVTILVGQIGQRVLVAGEATSANNGWYTITQQGVVALSPYILTRAVESDQATEIGSGYITSVIAANGFTVGSSNNGKVFISVAAANPFVVGTTNLTFSQVGSTYSAGNGLSLSGSTFSIDTSITVDKTTAQTLTNKTLTAPVMTAPVLGTPASGVGTNITGIPAANILAGSFGAGAYVISTSLQVTTLELGAATDTTIARVSAGVISVEGSTVALASNNLSFFSATTSAQLAGVISDETGSGALVFATSPTLVTPLLGTPTSGVLTNCTGLPAASVVAGALANGMTGTTQTFGDNSTKLATDAYVDGQFKTGYLNGDLTTGAGASTTITGLTFTAAANEVWSFEIYIVGQVSSTGGARFTVTYSNAPVSSSMVQYQGNTTGITVQSDQITVATTPAQTATIWSAATTDLMVRVAGCFTNANSSNTVTIKVVPVNGAQTVTIRSNSYLVARRIA